jgi:hypothetical protein
VIRIGHAAGLCGDCGAPAGTVLDGDILTEVFRHLLRDQPAKRIGRRPGAKWRDDPDRSGWIALRGDRIDGKGPKARPSTVARSANRADRECMVVLRLSVENRSRGDNAWLE